MRVKCTGNEIEKRRECSETVSFGILLVPVGKTIQECKNIILVDFSNISITNGNKQNTKRNRFTTLSAFFNFIASTLNPHLLNPCEGPMLKKMFKK
ncbi:MAG: hypothetical protein P8Y04_10680, partial [Desulfobulbaceae bacterium]